MSPKRTRSARRTSTQRSCSRGLELVREGGFAAQYQRSDWLFNKQYTELREVVFTKQSIRCVADLLWCAFEKMRHDTIAMYCLMRGQAGGSQSAGLTPTPRDEREESIPALNRKRAAVLCQEGYHAFDPSALKVVPEWPLVYWWSPHFLSLYSRAPKLSEAARVKNGLQTNDNTRYLRRPWEFATRTHSPPTTPSECSSPIAWVPYIKGANGVKWKQSYDWCVNWGQNGLDIKILNEWTYGSASRSVRSEELYFRPGVAMTSKGTDFGARAFDRPSIFDVEGRSVFRTRQRRCSDAAERPNSTFSDVLT